MQYQTPRNALQTFFVLLFSLLYIIPSISSKPIPSSAFLMRQNPINHRHRHRHNHQSSSSFSIIQRGGSDNIENVSSSSLKMITFDDTPFVQSTVIFTILNTLGCLISFATGSHVHLDLLGTGAFAVAAWVPFVTTSGNGMMELRNVDNTRVIISSLAVGVWGTKLALFLFYRALQAGNDKRLEDILSNFGGTVTFWVVSLVWGLICSLPHTLGTTSSSPGTPLTLIIGSILYLLGLIIESLADYQKYAFKQSNPSSWCNVGLWSVSQNPNYFGNLVLWLGIWVINSSSLMEVGVVGGSLWDKVWGGRRLLISVLSPLFMWCLFKGQVDGEMTPALELKMKRYGNDPEFVKYVETVPKIVPNLLGLFGKK